MGQVSGPVGTYSNVPMEIEQIVCKILVKELKLINIISFNLDKFYEIENFTVYDIVNFLNEGKLFFSENEIETFCMKFNIEISHNEMKTILFYFPSIGKPARMFLAFSTIK